ncbi:hypothetical protein BJP25_17395 [Actinokineospora bangkokensis]|uniref:AB hydrolase-1 domain-containing protein n=2 Tax=Actinokineospora bangkokensis TaxID=1193682 RepID=A0A1Q9LMY4_9PSEU|nr:hypothetical protein BJP25_17395 [Actinokineospora bangkokensis]
MLRRATAVVCLVLAAAAVVAGSSAAQTTGPPVLAWAACPGDAAPEAQCATLTVPLDHAHPGGATIDLALARIPATDPSRRIGSVVLNFGGPGASGVDGIAYGPSLSDSPELGVLHERFDLVSFDPRGIGRSAPVRCPSPLRDPAVSTFPSTPAEYAALTRVNTAAGERCRAATGPVIDHVDTASVVADVERIRAALGERRISWVGMSYGTEIGQRYAEAYPHRVRAMVLDGLFDHSRSTHQAALDEARATEDALHRFASWCTADPGCALHGQDVVARYDAVLAAAERGELVAPELGRPLTAVEAAEGVFGHLIARYAWTDLGTALATADASALATHAASLDQGYPAYRTVGCHDFPPDLRGWTDLAARAAEVRLAAPHTWRHTEFWDWTSGCAGWPIPPQNPPHPLRVTGAPPILLLSTTHDASTPLVWAQSVQRAIEGSRLLVADQDGHTTVLHSSCARTAIAAYLTEGALPAPGATCPSEG